MDDISKLNYRKQAEIFLNKCYDRLNEEQRQQVWDAWKLCVELDSTNGKDGNELQLIQQAPKLIRKFHGEALTIQQMKEKVDKDGNNRLSLIEFLCFQHGFTEADLLGGDTGNSGQIDDAARKVEAADLQLQIAIQSKKEAEEAASTAEKTKQDADQKEAELVEAEKKAATAKAEHDELVQMRIEEDKEFQAKKDELQAVVNDETRGVVARGTAAGKLSDLRKLTRTNSSEIRFKTSEKDVVWTVKKVALERERASEAKEVATQIHAVAVEALLVSEREIKGAERALAEAREAYEDAKTNTPRGCNEGSIWLMQREIEEANKYLPKRKPALSGATGGGKPAGWIKQAQTDSPQSEHTDAGEA